MRVAIIASLIGYLFCLGGVTTESILIDALTQNVNTNSSSTNSTILSNVPTNTTLDNTLDSSANETLTADSTESNSTIVNNNAVNETKIEDENNTTPSSENNAEIVDMNKPITNPPVLQTDEELAQIVFQNATFIKDVKVDQNSTENTPPPTASTNSTPNANVIVNDSTNSKEVSYKDDIGLIQTEGSEDEREDAADAEVENNGGAFVPPPLQPEVYVDDEAQFGDAASMPAIVASLFVVLCVVGYVSMMMWRRRLENKYGNREMLVNDDSSVYDPQDLRHFSL